MKNKVPLVHPYAIMRGFTTQVSDEDEDTMVQLSKEEVSILTGTTTMGFDEPAQTKSSKHKDGEMGFDSNDAATEEKKEEEEEGEGEDNLDDSVDALDTEQEASAEIGEIRLYQQQYEEQLRTKMRLMKKFSKRKKKLEAKMTFQQRPFIDGLVLLTYDFDTKVFSFSFTLHLLHLSFNPSPSLVIVLLFQSLIWMRPFVTSIPCSIQRRCTDSESDRFVQCPTIRSLWVSEQQAMNLLMAKFVTQF